MNKDSVFSHGYNADATPKTREFTKDDYREVLRHLHILEAVRDGAVIFADEGKGDIPADLIPKDLAATALTPLRKEAQNIAIQAQRDETIARRELSEETLGPLI
jgi:hypothetical protein